MRRALVAWLLVGAMPATLGAQRLVLGIAGAGGNYREISNDLRYRASGIAGSALVTVGRFAAEAAVAGLTYTPSEAGAAAEEFQAVQVDGYLRYMVYRGVSLEVGVTNRTVADEDVFGAQSAGAIRIGAHSAVELGPAVGTAVRFNYLAGSKFSGGGSAPFSLEVALSVYYGFGRGRVRLTGDAQFQQFKRKVDPGGGERDVPIQQILGRLGLALAL